MTPQKWKAVRWDWSLGGSPVRTTWLQQHVLRTLHRASWGHLLMRILVHREWEMWPLEIQIRLSTCVFQMTAVTPVRVHVDMGYVSMAGSLIVFHVLCPSLLPATAAQGPAPRVPGHVGLCSHTELGSVTPGALALHLQPAHPASNVRECSVCAQVRAQLFCTS